MCRRQLMFAIFAFVSLDTYVIGQPQEAAAAAEISSFRVRTYAGGPDSQLILKRCFDLRKQLHEYWQPNSDIAVWTPPCEIVLHQTRAQYLRAVGGFMGSSKGSSFVKFERNQVVKRRVDLLVNEQGETPALLHEVTHIFLADHFHGQQPPRWIDEGIATMVDTLEKQKLHQRDCRQALTTGTALRIGHLLTLKNFQTAEQVAPFYGQSLSLVRYLAERDQPHKLIDFTKTAMSRGYEHALKKHYGFDSVAALEADWRDYATTVKQPAIKPVSLTTTISER